MSTDDAIRQPFSVEDVPWEEWGEGTRFGGRVRALGQHAGCVHVGVVIEELPPGKQSCPAHYHYLEEEHVFILDGEVTLRLGDQRRTMRKGDYICFPAGQKAGHCLINEGDAVCRYLVIGERNQHEIVVYTDTNKVGVRVTGERYDKSATREYWEGETTTG